MARRKHRFPNYGDFRKGNDSAKESFLRELWPKLLVAAAAVKGFLRSFVNLFKDVHLLDFAVHPATQMLAYYDAHSTDIIKLGGTIIAALVYLQLWIEGTVEARDERESEIKA
jgi:hypothetical protein